MVRGRGYIGGARSVPTQGKEAGVVPQCVYRYAHEIANMTIDDAKGDKTLEYTKVKLDEQLQAILGEDFRPWDERYSFVNLGGWQAMTKQEAMKNFWQAQRELTQARTDFDYADKDHVEVATYRLAAAEKNLGVAHRLCKMIGG